jgi:hypothetical protein
VLPFLSALILIVLGVILWIWRSRGRSIVDIKGRNRHFTSIAKKLEFSIGGDEFFIQLEGSWKDIPVLIYPHSFEGPGSITVFYFQTKITSQERTWIEPSLSLGRAIVDWKRQVAYDFEVSGSAMSSPEILTELNNLKTKFPFVAVTLPTRFILSHYMMQTLSTWKHFVAILVLDAGRKPSIGEIQNTLDAGAHMVTVVEQSGAINEASS